MIARSTRRQAGSFRALIAIVLTAADTLPLEVAELDSPRLLHLGAQRRAHPRAAFSIRENGAPPFARPSDAVEPPVVPPPDLIIEIAAEASLNHLSSYAKLGVAEIWRYDDRTDLVTILRLRDGEYREKRESAALVPLTNDLLTTLVHESRTTPECVWQGELAAWLRTYD